VPEGGRYYISYSINLTSGLLLGSRLIINSAPNLASQITPLLNVSSLNNSIIVPLVAGSTISLEVFGLLGAATLQTGAGATLSIIRIDRNLV